MWLGDNNERKFYTSRTIFEAIPGKYRLKISPWSGLGRLTEVREDLPQKPCQCASNPFISLDINRIVAAIILEQDFHHYPQ